MPFLNSKTKLLWTSLRRESRVHRPLDSAPPGCFFGQARTTLQPWRAAETAAAMPQGVEPYTNTSPVMASAGSGWAAVVSAETNRVPNFAITVAAVPALRKSRRFMVQRETGCAAEGLGGAEEVQD
jgi:hypothetical protein